MSNLKTNLLKEFPEINEVGIIWMYEEPDCSNLQPYSFYLVEDEYWEITIGICRLGEKYDIKIYSIKNNYYNFLTPAWEISPVENYLKQKNLLGREIIANIKIMLPILKEEAEYDIKNIEKEIEKEKIEKIKKEEENIYIKNENKKKINKIVKNLSIEENKTYLINTSINYADEFDYPIQSIMSWKKIIEILKTIDEWKEICFGSNQCIYLDLDEIIDILLSGKEITEKEYDILIKFNILSTPSIDIIDDLI